MKNIALLLVSCFAWAGVATAQVTVEVVMDHEQFLPNESVPVKVNVINNSGETLHFGAEKWLSYSVEERDGTIVLKTGDVPSAHGFETRAGQTSTVRADLAPYFNLTRSARYAVTASVFIQGWGRDITSQPAHFDVIAGTKVWEQTFGVPQSAAGKGEPEVRKYILQQATLVKRLNLYFRLTDATESRSLKLYSLGPMISFSNPQKLVDSQSRLNLVYQSGAHVYAYLVINPDGEVISHQTYFYADSAPRLRTDDAGNPIIVGGVRHFADNDVPSSRKTSLKNDIPPLAP